MKKIRYSEYFAFTGIMGVCMAFASIFLPTSSTRFLGLPLNSFAEWPIAMAALISLVGAFLPLSPSQAKFTFSAVAICISIGAVMLAFTFLL